ncbi:MAG: trypsin-like peptidase domain-containing protein [Lapillicoccus sp.]
MSEPTEPTDLTAASGQTDPSPPGQPEQQAQPDPQGAEGQGADGPAENAPLAGASTPEAAAHGPRAALPWNDFGVPDGDSAEPPSPLPPSAPAYPLGPPSYGATAIIPTATQPIETSPWAQHDPATAEAPSMWGVPSLPPSYPGLPDQEGFGTGGAPPAPSYGPQPPYGPPPPYGQPAYGQQEYGPQSYGPQSYGQPLYGQGPTPPAYAAGGPAPSGPRSPFGSSPALARKPRRVVGTVAIALMSALIGGGAVVTGNHFLNEGTSLGAALPAPGPGSTARPDGSIAKIAATALPSVVTIKIKASGGSGTGSGFVIDKQGHILTNNHVVAAAGGGGTITVELNNGTDLPAEVVGQDASYDLAVIKVSATDLVPLEFGRSADVVVGDGVIAVGAPLGLDATVTSGIVSALNRPVTPGDGNETSYINAIQTDAAINPGNSGGPLLDMNGRVIGVNSAIARVPGSSADAGGSIGVGFSIPSDQAAKTAQQLISTGKAVHPVLGVNVDQGYDGDGAKIASGGVKAGSPAAGAGLKEGDVVVEFEGHKVADANALIVAVRAKNVGDTVKLKVQRDSQSVDVTLTLQGATG